MNLLPRATRPQSGTTYSQGVRGLMNQDRITAISSVRIPKTGIERHVRNILVKIGCFLEHRSVQENVGRSNPIYFLIRSTGLRTENAFT